MSVVTNIILTFSSGESEQQIIAKLAEHKYNGNMPFLMVSVNDEKLPKNWYGGTKNLEANILIGAYNHLDLQPLLIALQKIKWENPQDVVLMVKEENDTKFKIVDIW